MIALILGEPSTGKSRRAEDLTLELAGGGRRVYLATMTVLDAEGRERVARHRKAREGKGFVTVERPRDVASLTVERGDLKDAVWLLECAANLVGNEMHAPVNAELNDDALVRTVVESIATLGASVRALVVVSNEFPQDDPRYDDETRRYVAILHKVDVALCKLADRVDRYAKGAWISDETP